METQPVTMDELNTAVKMRPNRAEQQQEWSPTKEKITNLEI